VELEEEEVVVEEEQVVQPEQHQLALALPSMSVPLVGQH
jgi:hypothetical protein